jgi:hypothetical protein
MNKKFLCTLALAALPVSSAWAVGLIDLRTTTADNSNTLTDRLYLNSTFTPANEAPVGTSLWIVWDSTGNGLPFNPAGSGDVHINNLLGADDQIVMNLEVDGTLLGDQTGRFQQAGLSLSDSANVAGQRFYAFLWHPTNGGNTSGNPDNLGEVVPSVTFGVSSSFLNFAFDDSSIAGNGRLDISANINASQFTVVPEPEEYAALFGATLVGFALWRRSNRR